MTYNGAVVCYYIDGVLYASSNQTLPVTYNATAPVGSGAEATTSSTAYDAAVALFLGQMSDFRIYATALDANDVKELYETSMEIDSNGNILPRILTS